MGFRTKKKPIYPPPAFRLEVEVFLAKMIKFLFNPKIIIREIKILRTKQYFLIVM
jgi:hypothetical protein